LGQLRETSNQIIELGYQMIFVSPDRPEKIAAYRAKQNFDYTLVSDSDSMAAEAMGVAYRVSDELVEKLISLGIDIEEASGKKHHMLPVPAVFIFDDKQVVRFNYADPDYRARIDPDLLLSAAKAVAK
jgi:peroxiredoxin